jgi:predicted nucleic acid-binding protein
LIVVDTNVVAYAVLPSDHAEVVRALASRDPEWLAPPLWRSEFRNVLAVAMRVRGLSLARALRAFAEAETLVVETGALPSTKECLEIAERGRVSAYDAEYVCVAAELGLLLVTADRRLARAFPDRVRLLEQFAAG